MNQLVWSSFDGRIFFDGISHLQKPMQFSGANLHCLFQVGVFE